MRRGMLILACGVGLAMGVGAAGAQTDQTAKRTTNEVKVKLIGSQGQPAGTVTFRQVKQGVKMTVKLENVPFGEHAVHIHEHAVCDAPDFHAAGGHFNPLGKHHGFENPEGHHAGDLPANVSVGENHRGEASFVLKDVSMDPNLPNSIFANGGTSVVVHEHGDDQKTDPSGNSGNRIACGVVKE
ncbi:MAG TPA: superoxide dismutase family protein [Acidobacteriaceae bacterium]|nr:superoxide dismutase family protein [Acidobacteriaceae bacterium]